MVRSSARLKRRESRLQIRGNPKIKFARKPHFRPQKLANAITSPRSIIQLAQWLRETSRATEETAPKKVSPARIKTRTED
jgi:hypothetical protein